MRMDSTKDSLSVQHWPNTVPAHFKSAAGARTLAGLFQGLDEEEDFGSHRVAQIRSFGERAIMAAGNDSFEGVDEREEPRCVGIGGELLEEESGGSRVVGEQGLGYG